MANYFEITRPEGLNVAKLDSSGRAEVQYTVRNVSGIKREGRAVLVSIPPSPSGPAEKNWVKLDGVAQRSFDPGQSQTFMAKVAVPPKGVPEGSYSFRLDTVLVDRPDEGDQGQPVSFTIGPKVVAKSSFKWWIPVAAVGALVVIGVLVWLLMPKGVAVPDLKGQVPADAKGALAAVGLGLDPNSDLIDSTPDLVGKIAAQSLPAGSKAKKGSTVKVSLGAVEVTVPDVRTQPLDKATTALTTVGLQVGTVTSLPVPNTTGGFVMSQSIAKDTRVKSNTPVDLTVAQVMVAVPPVKSLPIGQAVLAISNAKLVFAGVSGDQYATSVTGTSPPEGTIVNVGTPVTVTVPCARSEYCFISAAQYQSNIISKAGVFERAPVARFQKW